MRYHRITFKLNLNHIMYSYSPDVKDERTRARVNLGNGEIGEEDRMQFELGNKTYDELLKSGVLLPGHTLLERRPHVDKQMQQLLKCKKMDSIELEVGGLLPANQLI